ncbi:sugar transferase [Paenibacillus sp. FSL R7-0652]|uniref:Sugar transferase n=1 Tax=Paenibacillus sp. AN1007 TaxID=3151385 RepID=A0AAU8N7F7_9BACL
MNLSGTEYVVNHETAALEGSAAVLGQTYSQRLGGYANFWKPLIDVTAAAILLLAVSPVMILLSILIKVDSKGSIIFRQDRYGKNGVKFSIYKFRTMYVDAPKYSVSPTSSLDPRITRVGRFLRKTSLDELPQLLNILKGEMSFIGPRPELKTIVEQHYTELERRRFLVKPGITGLWQVSEARKEPIHHNLQYDFHYILNMSLVMDLKVIIRTVRVMIKSNTF